MKADPSLFTDRLMRALEGAGTLVKLQRSVEESRKRALQPSVHHMELIGRMDGTRFIGVRNSAH